MFELKRLSKEAVPAALERAQRYRTLNEPLEAESICLDVLETDRQNDQARITLLLALTDQFQYRLSETLPRAQELVPELSDEYSRAYYGGIIHERCAKARLREAAPGSGFWAYEDFRDAMTSYEKAAEIRPRGNDDAILRWNTCARYLNRHPDVRPQEAERSEEMLE